LPLTGKPEPDWSFDQFDKIRRRAAALDGLRKQAGAVNPRLPGWHNDLIQLFKKTLARFLNWYTQPVHEFNSAVSRSVQELVWAVDHLAMSLVALDPASRKRVFENFSVDLVDVEEQLAEIKTRGALVDAPMRERLELLHRQVELLVNLQEAATREVPAATATMGRGNGGDKDPRISIDRFQGAGGNGIHWQGIEWKDRTTYIIGLFGTGRKYVNELLLYNLGDRAKYFRDTIRLHPGPTPMIYSGHVTMKHVSRAQEIPPIMRCILENVRSGFAQVIFIYRHPLDSLLTNWVWWRTHMRDKSEVYGISEVYKNVDDLCADLDQNFLEFMMFVEGDPNFFKGLPGPRFLSFPEFVEETELHLQAATLTLRLEDFTIDPSKEFSKILDVMAVDIDATRLSIPLPRAKPYGYRIVQEKVGKFKTFVAGLDAETRSRIERIGYTVS
jgi:hypothetical protein